MNTITTCHSFSGVLATVLGAFALSLATVCTATEPMNAPQITVKFSDLNVSTSAGASALYARIVRAAREVCRALDERNYGSPMQDFCVHKAIADAVAKVGRPALFDAYNAHNARPTPIALTAQSR
jgi:UrcA family protein